MGVTVHQRTLNVSIGPNPRQIALTETQTQLIQAGQQGLPGRPGDDGAEGPPGVAGPSGDGQYPAIHFAYGDASGTVLVLTADHDSEITLVQLEIETPFDGDGASLMLGTLADPDLLLASDDVDPAEVAIVEVSPRTRMAAGSAVRLTINPGTGASQGAGTIVIQATPIS